MYMQKQNKTKMKKYMQEQNRLWDYKVLHELGRGQYGQVYKVELQKSSKIYALKKINLGSSHEKEKIQAFREIKALKLIHHPDIIQYYDSFLSMDNIYIVMEYAAKGDIAADIRKRKKREKNYTEQELWEAFSAMVNGVKHLHQKNIIHRDIKAENIFITEDKKYKVGDLGMSKIIHEASQLLSTRVGTPVYFAPEVIQNQLYSFPVDIWALGCVFYNMAALQHPFKDATIETLGYYIIDQDPKPIRGPYSPSLISFIMSLLDRNPKTRPSIYEVHKKLKERHELKYNNKISIFNIKQILALKAESLGRQKQKRKEYRSMDSRKMDTQKIHSRVLVGDPEKSEEKESVKPHNLSMILPKAQKSTKKTGLSPMIKSNGFTTNFFHAQPASQRKAHIMVPPFRYNNQQPPIQGVITSPIRVKGHKSYR